MGRGATSDGEGHRRRLWVWCRVGSAHSHKLRWVEGVPLPEKPFYYLLWRFSLVPVDLVSCLLDVIRPEGDVSAKDVSDNSTHIISIRPYYERSVRKESNRILLPNIDRLAVSLLIESYWSDITQTSCRGGEQFTGLKCRALQVAYKTCFRRERLGNIYANVDNNNIRRWVLGKEKKV